jgi:Cu(I)/Ag(I) efflux system membrane protein CusA/SilA
VYLEEAVKKAIAAKGRPGPLGRDELIAAVKEGARLRLRPKVMTVATAVAGLVPIFWSTRTGVEVMRPLAAPVVGGMLSSLVHILIVTPVIFAWLHERKLRQPAATP